MNVEVILDGATDHEGDVLELPALRGELYWRELLDPGVPVGSETAIASLLGWRPSGAVDRGLVEAAARGLGWDAARRVDFEGGHKLLVSGGVEVGGPVTRVWDGGERPPEVLDRSTVVIG
ncbi:MAG: hypothetical protein J2O48_13870, partial [Solirubrobacterales bacterium]|nr:hypothetical protein [Solirubrobacterales bacterium]